MYRLNIDRSVSAFSEQLSELKTLTLPSLPNKTALFEKIEEEYDIRIGQEAYEEYVADRRKSRPVDELWKECDL